MVNHPNRSKRPKWQPIETAPVDQPILVYEAGAMVVCSAMKINGSTYWNPEGVDGYNIESPDNPTHWMPLPPPPTLTT